MGGFTVTPAEVSALGDALLRVKAAVEGAEGVTESYRGFLGSGPIADRLDAAMKNWSEQRGKIIENLDAAGRAAKGAAEIYQQTDQSITGASAGKPAAAG